MVSFSSIPSESFLGILSEIFSQTLQTIEYRFSNLVSFNAEEVRAHRTKQSEEVMTFSKAFEKLQASGKIKPGIQFKKIQMEDAFDEGEEVEEAAAAAEAIA